MAGPSPQFLADMWAPFAAGEQLAGVGRPSAAPVLSGAPLPPIAPAPNATGYPSLVDVPAAPPPAPPQAPAPPPQAATPLPQEAPPNTAPIGAPPPPAPETPPEVEFRPVQSGGMPARELPTRGPRQNAYLEASFQPGLEAADRIDARSTDMAQREAAFFDHQAEEEMKRGEAMQRVAARRQQEMQQRIADYDNTIQAIGNSKIDGNRLWANASTPDKIGTIALAFIGGMTGGADGMLSRMIQKRFEDDVELQKFDYEKGLNIARGQQTAYSMAMDKYGSEDAAYHAAMSSAQLAAAAKINSLSAQWKGVDAQNQADMLRAQLMQGAARSAAEGYKYLQPTAGGTRYEAYIRGQRRPGTVDEKKAGELFDKYGTEHAQGIDNTLVKAGVESTLEEQKAGHALRKELAKDRPALEVRLPNGETVVAPDKEEAGKLRDLSVSVSRVQRLVADAKAIRSDPTFRISPEGRSKLGQIQKDLVTQFAVQNKLGALSNADMDLAVGGTADLFQIGNGVEARLDRLASEALRGRVERVATYPGAPPKSSGQMPGSFQVAK